MSVELHMSSTSHKGEKTKLYTVDFKLEAVKFAEDNSIQQRENFKVDRHSIRDWKNKKAKLEDLKRTTRGAKRARLDGAGRKLTDAEIEERASEWIFDRRGKGLRVSRKMIMLKAKSLQDEKCQRDEGNKILSYSRGWLEKFMNRNGLSLRRRTTEAHKTPDQLVDKLCAYNLKIRRLRTRFNYDLRNIIAMDETAIWNDMISETTVEKRGAHTVHLKTTGREKSKVTVWPL